MRTGLNERWCPAVMLQQHQELKAAAENGETAYPFEYLLEDAASYMTNASRVLPARFREAECDLVLNDIGLYLWGDVGVGKTHAAAGLARQAMYSGRQVKWCCASSWLASIRASFNGGPTPSSPTELADTDLLVLDDLGAEKPSEWAIEQLYTLVNLAYEADVQLIVTSNLRLRALEKRIGERIVSRIAELCDTVEITGEDRRLLAMADRMKPQNSTMG